MLQTVRVEIVDEKNEVICLLSRFPFWVIVIKLSKKVEILQFCAELSKKSTSIKVIYIYASTYISLHAFRKWYCLLWYDLLFWRY